MPNDNQRILIDRILEEERRERAPEVDEGEFFELFTAEQSLKDFDLSYDEIDAGIVDGGRDGGVDALYLMVDRQLLSETDIAQVRRAESVELVIIQAKRKDSFEEGPLVTLTRTLHDLLPLDTQVTSLAGRYKIEVREGFDLFRRAVNGTARSGPRLRIRVVYSCRGGIPSPGVKDAASSVTAEVRRQYPAAAVDINFLGAPELLALFRRTPQSVYTMNVAERIDLKQPGIDSEQPGVVALVRLGEFNKLISDDDGYLRNGLFDTNVRDYQGSVSVNKQISDTLRTESDVEFWWLNNGVTVLVDHLVQNSRTLSLTNPQIVNGLQTSFEISRFFREQKPRSEKRHVLVRVIDVNVDVTRDRIIRATNSQTRIPESSLRGTDPVHRDIEEILRSRGLFYERRKNFYKNLKKPKAAIVSIGYLAQAVMACLLQRSNDSRARPGTLLNSDIDYRRVFSDAYPVRMYATAAALMKRVDEFLQGRSALTRNQRTNYRFHLAMMSAIFPSRGQLLSPNALADLDLDDLDDKYLTERLQDVRKTFTSLRKEERSLDDIAKGADIVPALVRRAKRPLIRRKVAPTRSRPTSTPPRA